MNEAIDIKGLAKSPMPVKGRVSAEEWQARENLAACYRLVAHFRLTDMIYNHISLRVPGQEDAILLNAFGLWYEEVTASNLVKVTLAGEVLDDVTGMGINKAGYVIHSAIHRARPDVYCVLHTHTAAGMAVSAQKHGLLPITQNAAPFIGRVGHHAYEGVALRYDEQERLVASLGEHRALILDNHGLLTAGRSVAEAFMLMMLLERACVAQVAALAGGGPLKMMSEESIEETRSLSAAQDPAWPRDWEAMIRLCERIGPDFRD